MGADPVSRETQTDATTRLSRFTASKIAPVSAHSPGADRHHPLEASVGVQGGVEGGVGVGVVAHR
jgi:hypothetical protein